MHLTQLRLRDFRNYARSDANFAPGFHLLLGDNAQGKTNILEAIYLISTLRSFRGVGSAQLVRHGQKGYFVGGKIVGQGEHEAKLYWSVATRSLNLDGRAVRKLGDYLGVFRTVVFCTEDLQLVKGPARTRRRFIDLLLSQTHPGYLSLLQVYAQALRSRNAVLKRPNSRPEILDGFSQSLVKAGNDIFRLRQELIPKFLPHAQVAFQRIAGANEELSVEYAPSVRADFVVELAQSRSRETAYRATVVGPHRDEVVFKLNGMLAAQFGSEGQKRSLVIALKMAQAHFLTDFFGSPPVLLIDDVMGELDLKRRSGLIPLLQRSQQARGQVFMTATEENWPRELEVDLQRWRVNAGILTRAEG